jgi:hypothetical protein
VENLNGTMDDETILAYIQHVNTLWAQACIAFEVESIVDMDAVAEGEELFLNAIASPVKGAVSKAIRAAIPAENLLETGWNVVIIRDFGVPASGFYDKEIDAVIFAQGKYAKKPTHPTILGHELGHSLGLPHYKGSGLETNMMHEGGAGVVEESIELTDDQIDIARDQAASGDAY